METLISPAKLTREAADSVKPFPVYDKTSPMTDLNKSYSCSSTPAKKNRPFRVWNCDRTLKKCMTAFSLKDLKLKGSKKLRLNTRDVSVVFEEDGSELDEEEYFEFLPTNCVLMLLKPGESWLSRRHMMLRAESVEIAETGLGVDETDHGDSGDELDEETRQLAQDIRENMINIINFSTNQLQKLADAPTEKLAKQLGKSERSTRSVQDSCQRRLDTRKETRQMVKLLNLYQDSDFSGSTLDNRASRKRKALDAGDA